ncbi:MAG: hypothetical protein R3F02_02195 [Thiolinea sp.]
MNNTNTQQQPETWAEQLLKNKTAGELRRMHPKIQFFYLVSAAGAFAASFMFVGGVWLGANWHPTAWTTENWVAVGIALLMVGGITAGQYFSYSTGIKSGLMIFAKAVVILFALGSEISQTMEREAETVRNRSEQSEVFKATVGAIQSATNAPVQVSPALADAQAEAATAQVEIDACERHRSKGQARVDKCLRIERGNLAAAQARIKAIQDQAATTAAANQSTALAMVDQAKQLQFDEKQHFQGIQFIQKIFGVSAIAAAFIFAFGIIGTFESMFWLLGALLGAIGQALKAYGLTPQGRLISDEYKEMGLMQDAPAPEPKQPHNEYAPSQSVGFSPSPTLAAFNQYKQSGHPVAAAAASADWLAGKLSGSPAPVSNLTSTYNRELAKHQIDSPADAVLNKTADQAAIQRIISKGRNAGLGTAETQLSMRLESGQKGLANRQGGKVEQQPSERVSKGLANRQAGLYEKWIEAVREGACRPAVKPTWLWIQKRISNKETGSRTHDRTRISTMQKAFFNRAIHDGLMQQNPDFKRGGKKYIWIG